MTTLHTGQHYDTNLNDVFFEELDISRPEHQLRIGSASHPTQIAEMMLGIEQVVATEKPDYILVYGDTNSTLAGALVSAKLNLPLVHVEAGLRSYQRDMPEEINRIITDRISNILCCPSQEAIDNLIAEGIDNQCFMVGDIMKDMVRNLPMGDDVLSPPDFIYTTIHRPENTDDKHQLQSILNRLEMLPYPVVFSLHPRTKSKVELYNIDLSQYQNISCIEPVRYYKNLNYIRQATWMITDSGGIQKEAYWLSTPCLTVRKSTEWVETLVGKWNTLISPKQLTPERLLSLPDPEAYNPALYGDGDTAPEILDVILAHYRSC